MTFEVSDLLKLKKAKGFKFHLLFMAFVSDYDYLFKVLLVGDAGAGKTNILLRYTVFSIDALVFDALGWQLHGNTYSNNWCRFCWYWSWDSLIGSENNNSRNWWQDCEITAMGLGGTSTQFYVHCWALGTLPNDNWKFLERLSLHPFCLRYQRQHQFAQT